MRAHHLTFIYFYGKGRSFAYFGAFDQNFAPVVLFYDPFGKGKPKAPTAGFGGIAGFKNRFKFTGRNAFAGI